MLVAVTERKAELCREILTELPEWFGIPAAVEEYCRVATPSDVIGYDADGRCLGIAVMRLTSSAAAEIYLLAVRLDHHRKGIGRALVGAAVDWTRERRCSFLTVKTLGPSHPSLAYAATRAFYEAVGFAAIEEFESIWPGNPCLLMLRAI